MGRDRRQINVKGGGYLSLREIDPTPTNGFTLLGFIGESTWDVAFNMVESKDDAGNYIDTKEAGQMVSFESSLLQSDKVQADFMITAASKYFEFYYKVLLNNGQTQELLFPLARLNPGMKWDFKAAERRTPLKFWALWPQTALTRVPTDYNSAIGEYYKLIQNTVPKGEPSDAATIPQGAITG